MLHMRFARLVLLIQALVWAGLAIAYWLKPYEMTSANGVLLMDIASVTETQVFYGGMQFGLALFTGLAFFRQELVRAALVLIVFLQLSTTSVRFISVLFAEAASFDLLSHLYEVTIVVLAIVALRLLDRWERDQRERYSDEDEDED